MFKRTLTYLLDGVSADGREPLPHEVVRAKAFRLARDGELRGHEIAFSKMLAERVRRCCDFVPEGCMRTTSTARALFERGSKTAYGAPCPN